MDVDYTCKPDHLSRIIWYCCWEWYPQRMDGREDVVLGLYLLVINLCNVSYKVTCKLYGRYEDKISFFVFNHWE